MAETAREYLIHRFRGDAEALRSRCEVLQRGTKVPGPCAFAPASAAACRKAVSAAAAARAGSGSTLAKAAISAPARQPEPENRAMSGWPPAISQAALPSI